MHQLLLEIGKVLSFENLLANHKHLLVVFLLFVDNVLKLNFSLLLVNPTVKCRNSSTLLLLLRCRASLLNQLLELSVQVFDLIQ